MYMTGCAGMWKCIIGDNHYIIQLNPSAEELCPPAEDIVNQ